jgi:hypothetical protein
MRLEARHACKPFSRAQAAHAMQVIAFSTPSRPEWRWRIVSYSGELVEESRETFSTISIAVARGTKRLSELNIVDRSVAATPYRSTSHLRRR